MIVQHIAAELQLLAAAVLLGFVQLNLAALAARSQQGYRWGTGPRDEPRPLVGIPARLERAYANFMETFAFFAAAVLAAGFASKFGPLTLWGSWLYLIGRVLYVPLYACGVPFVRTLVWQVASVGMVMVAVALFV